MSREFNAVVYEPEIVTNGFILPRDCDELLGGLRKKAVEAASRANGNIRRDVEEAVREYIYSETRRRPIRLCHRVQVILAAFEVAGEYQALLLRRL